MKLTSVFRMLPRYGRELKFLAAAGLAMAASTTGAYANETPEAPPAAKPSIIVIVADDLGYGDLGIQGGKDVPTPNIDALANAGARFTNGYVSCPVCSPTRAGLLSGRYQQRFGHEFNPGPGRQQGDGDGFGLPLDQVTVANVLKQAGYHTGIVGKWHLGYAPAYQPQKRGFDEFFGFLGGAHKYFPGQDTPRGPIYRGQEVVDEQEYLTDAFGREAVAYIERNAATPFFLYLTFNAVHNPLEATDKYLERFPDIADAKRKPYAAMLSALDENIGRVLKTLEDRKLTDNTLVVFISDNGGPTQGNGSQNTPLTGNKGSVWEGGIRVPYFLKWPGRVPAGLVYDKPVISLDIFPTVAAAGGATLPTANALDGVNLLPFVTEKSDAAPHQQLFWRFGPQWAVRQGSYKLLKTGSGAPQLIDLTADIGEQHDLAAGKPELAKELQAAYDEWDAQLAQPLWKPQGGQGRRRQQQAAGKANAPRQAAQLAPAS